MRPPKRKTTTGSTPDFGSASVVSSVGVNPRALSSAASTAAGGTTGRVNPDALPPISEADFTSQVIGFAELCGWKPAHFRPLARRKGKGWETPVQGSGGVGFPDLLGYRIGRTGKTNEMFAAELKSEDGTVSAEQHEWLRAFAAMGIPAFVWRPSHWQAIEKFLRGEL